MSALYEYAGGARSVGRRRSRGAARGGDRERLQAPEKQVEQVPQRGRVAARPRPHLPRQAPHRQRVQSALRAAPVDPAEPDGVEA
eukprot:scaffold38941_cov40-Phaeocystis_antarctica.AAC.2